jgi:hypothetical protein
MITPLVVGADSFDRESIQPEMSLGNSVANGNHPGNNPN